MKKLYWQIVVTVINLVANDVKLVYPKNLVNLCAGFKKKRPIGSLKLLFDASIPFLCPL